MPKLGLKPGQYSESKLGLKPGRKERGGGGESDEFKFNILSVRSL